MPRCRPGDIAVVISAYNPCNLGRIVSVLRLQDEGDSLRVKGELGPVWVVRDACGRRMKWKQAETGQQWRRVIGPVPDAQLQPIRGLPPGDLDSVIDILSLPVDPVDEVMRAHERSRKAKERT